MRLLKLLPLALIMMAASCSAPAVDVPPSAYTQLSQEFSGAFDLIDQNGQALSDEALKGKTGVFYFGFTSCPGICQSSLRLLGAAHSQLSASEREKLAAMFITVDPERDTPQRVTAFLKDYPFLAEGKALTPVPAITGLTGPREAVDAAMKGFRMAAWRQELEGSALEYTMNHMDVFYITDKQGQPVLLVHSEVTPDQLTALIRRYL